MLDDNDSCEERTRIFMKCLYEEKKIHKDHRFLFVQRKLLFIGTLLGISSLRILNPGLAIDLDKIVYLIPFIAIAYDIFILAEDFKIKRIGFFLLEKCKFCEEETNWENFVKINREPLAAYGTVLLTVLAFLASVVILILGSQQQSEYHVDWSSVELLIKIMSLYIACYWILMGSNKNMNKKT